MTRPARHRGDPVGRIIDPPCVRPTSAIRGKLWFEETSRSERWPSRQ
jgi:hypothetical protein